MIKQINSDFIGLASPIRITSLCVVMIDNMICGERMTIFEIRKYFGMHDYLSMEVHMVIFIRKLKMVYVYLLCGENMFILDQKHITATR